jgi:hypothetical protein
MRSLSPKGATYPILQVSLHHGGTEARRHRGKQADAPPHRLPGRTDGRTPLLIQEGDGAFAPGGGYGLQEGSVTFCRGWLQGPNSQCLTSGSRLKLRCRQIGNGGIPVPVFPFHRPQNRVFSSLLLTVNPCRVLSRIPSFVCFVERRFPARR